MGVLCTRGQLARTRLMVDADQAGSGAEIAPEAASSQLEHDRSDDG